MIARQRKTQVIRFSRIGACSVAAMALLTVAAARQLGALPHLPDPPGKLFNSDRIVCSRSSRIVGVPDAMIGIASYATTFALANFAARRPDSHLRRGALGLKVGVDAVAGVSKALGQWPRNRALCSWCLAVTAASLGNLLLFPWPFTSNDRRHPESPRILRATE